MNFDTKADVTPALSPEQEAELVKNLQQAVAAATPATEKAPARPAVSGPPLDPLAVFRQIKNPAFTDEEKYAAIRSMSLAARQTKVHEVSKAQMWRVIAWLLDHGPQRGRAPRLADAITGKKT